MAKKSKKDCVVPTACKDWSLNVDAESDKQFWWHKTYSISVWQASLNVAEPLAAATDDAVWGHYLRYQLRAVYKLCSVCDGPEQNEGLHLCCYCGGCVHATDACSKPATREQIEWKPANAAFASLLRVCRTCDGVPKGVPVAPPVRETVSALRGVTRALTLAEYPADIRTELTGLQELLQRGGIADAAAMAAAQAAVLRYFQPGNSASLLRKERIATKGDGIGVVAAADIPRFTIIGVYPGYEDALSGEHVKVGRPNPRYSLVDLNCADYFNVVFEELQSTFTPFINEPNVGEQSNTAWIQETVHPEGRLSVMTVRDIRAGEELMIGYGPLYPRCYPYAYDAYAYHQVDGFSEPPCFALWHWPSLEEKDAAFVCYCGFSAEDRSYYYWETEDDAQQKGRQQKAGGTPSPPAPAPSNAPTSPA